jgi:alkanesulfonate monooxygenase SsuD/methylene tetrahydromethanopterin reductase-like flavin-dependent oxidoreductase (luciferase family)
VALRTSPWSANLPGKPAERLGPGVEMVELATEIRWQDRRFQLPMERILLSERLGYDAVFTAEGYGSDAFVPLGLVAGHTTRLKLGTRIAEVTGRPPAVSAMAYQTLNHLTGGGRVLAGLGVASPMAAEGLQGTPWGRPVARMRDYVTLLRQGLSGQPLEHVGTQWSAPYRGEGHLGIPPAALGLEPLGQVPVLIAAAGPQLIQLAAEIGDGWLPPGFAPGMMPGVAPTLEAGFARRGGRPDDFAIWCQVDVLVDDDVRAAMRPFKEYTVTWSAMQRPMMVARGYTELADRLADLLSSVSPADAEVRVQNNQNLLPDPLWEQALDAVPDEYIDEGWLVGPLERIRGRVAPWLDCGLTGLVIRYGPQLTHEPVVEDLAAFRVIAEAAGKEPVG